MSAREQKANNQTSTKQGKQVDDLFYAPVQTEPLTSKDLEKLKLSYIPEALAQEAGIFRVSNDEGKLLVGRKDRQNYAGIAIPYYWPGESHPRAYRLRRDEPDIEIKSDGSIKEKGKYMSEPGRGNRLYFSPGHKADELQDITIPLVITEGEKKVLGLEQYQREKNKKLLPCGLPGVWSFKGKRGKVDLPDGGKKDVNGIISDFDFIKFAGRKVYLVFDVNAGENQSVKAAERQLVKILRGLGANVIIVRLLPELKDQNINGIDDILGKFGSDYVEKLFKEAEINNIEEKEAKERKLDDLDFALLFADAHSDIRYDEDPKVFRQWTGTHWEIYNKQERLKVSISKLIRETSPDTNIGDRKVVSITNLAKGHCSQDFQVNSKHLINFQNGTLNTLTKEFYEHNPEDGLVSVLPYSYDPFNLSSFHNIQAFLESAIPDKLARYALMVHCGLALLNDRRMHNGLFLYGATRSGKTVSLALINLICGSTIEECFNFAGASLLDKGTEGKRSRALWNQYKFVGLDEMPKEAFRSEEILKSILSHSGSEMRKIGKDEIIGNKWQPKLAFAANDKPNLSDVSGAVRERLLIINFPNSRPTKEQNKLLLDSFIPELGSFAATCLRMAEQALKCGSYPISKEMQQTFNNITLLSNPLKMFVVDKCVLDPDAWITTSEIYTSYKQFCEEEGNKPLNKNRIASSLTDMFTRLKLVRRGSNGERGIAGIRLRKDGDPINSSFSQDESVDEEFFEFDNIFTSKATDTTDTILTQEKSICQSINTNNINNISSVLTQLTVKQENLSYRDMNLNENLSHSNANNTQKIKESIDTEKVYMGDIKANFASVASVTCPEETQIQQNQAVIDTKLTDTQKSDVSASVSSVSTSPSNQTNKSSVEFSQTIPKEVMQWVMYQKGKIADSILNEGTDLVTRTYTLINRPDFQKYPDELIEVREKLISFYHNHHVGQAMN